jgi:hypothetical protein
MRKKLGIGTIEITNKIPPIITEEVFYECQENIKRNSRNYYRNKRYLFMQKLECPKCGRIMSCNGTRKPDGKDYLYYKCTDCETYIREEQVENVLVKHLVKLLELYLVLEENYYPVDSDIAEDFNNCKINNKIRFAIDKAIIYKKTHLMNYDMLFPIWENTSYDTKCNFIYEYIDKIKVKKKTGKSKKITEVEFLDLKLKPNKINKFFELKEKI